MVVVRCDGGMVWWWCGVMVVWCDCVKLNSGGVGEMMVKG